MYTVLIQNDNSVVATERQRIMQGSKLVDALQIVVPKLYNGLEMASCTARLDYFTPINRTHGYTELEISDPDYKSDYLLYRMNIDNDLTTEVGDVHFLLTFIKQPTEDDISSETFIRKIDTFPMSIISIADWSVLPDTDTSALNAVLSVLDQRIIANEEALIVMNDIQSKLSTTKLDDIKLDADTNTLYGTSHGVKQGTGVNINDLGDTIADNVDSGMVYMNTFDEEGDS